MADELGRGAPLGNENGKRGREWRDALRNAMAHRADGDYRKTLLKIAANVVDQALSGDKDAIREIAERTDGKATVVLAGDDERPPVAVINALDVKL